MRRHRTVHTQRAKVEVPSDGKKTGKSRALASRAVVSRRTLVVMPVMITRTEFARIAGSGHASVKRRLNFGPASRRCIGPMSRGGHRMRIVDLTPPINREMPGIHGLGLYDQNPTRRIVLSVVSEG